MISPPRIATAMLAAVLLLPLADATTIVTVDGQSFETTQYDAPYSDTYSFSFAGTIFNPPPVFHGTVEAAADFGEVTTNQVVHWSTAWNVTDANGVSVILRIDGVGGKHWSGRSARGWTVSVNGSTMWDLQDQEVGELWSTFIYQDSHIFQYGENMTVRVPVDGNGVEHWDATQGIDPLFNNDLHWGHRTADEPLNHGALYLIQPDLGADSFGFDNSTYSKFWIANMTGPVAISIITSYTDRTPVSLTMDRQFLTQARFIATDRPFACSWPTIERYVGFCPSLASVAGFMVGLLPNMFGSLIGLVSPEWGSFFKTAGDWAGEFVSAIVFTQLLLVASPGKLIVIMFFSVSGAANLIGGLRGDLGSVVYLNFLFFKYTLLAVFWYFYVYWLILKWSFHMVMLGLQMLAQWTTALNPEILGFKL